MLLMSIGINNKIRILRGINMNDINKTIKHFESLQKRYTTQHNGQMCDRVADALEALYCFKNEELEFTRKFIHEHDLEFALASAWDKHLKTNF